MAKSPAELASLIAVGGRFELRAGGTKQGLGRPVAGATVLDMSSFTGISLYEPDELVLEAGPATSLAEIEKTLSKHNQQLAFEPPDYSRLLGSNGSGSLGGLVACGLAGPRRIKAGAARDHILGVAGVSGRGEVFKAGGRVVKNVTGFDISKLMVGAHGTLAALTSITLKVLPAAATEETLLLRGLTDARAVQAMGLAMQSDCDVSGAAHLPGDMTLLRLEGVGPSVRYRRDRLATLLNAFGRSDVLGEKQSRQQWMEIRDVHLLAKGRHADVWRLSVVPSKSPEIIADITRKLDVSYFMDWAGGLIWIAVPATADASAALIRGSFADGHATLIRASAEVRARIDVFQPQAPALSELSARVKTSFDPNHVLNPGRMYKDI
jgi:glycolate oxidase FAD binding subunit